MSLSLHLDLDFCLCQKLGAMMWSLEEVDSEPIMQQSRSGTVHIQQGINLGLDIQVLLILDFA
jgi:hypothetical protein